jgi:hypothetical protein
VTNGSADVTGNGTAWTTALEGKIFKVEGVDADYTIDTVAAAGELSLTAVYAGTTATAADYHIVQDLTSNYSLRKLFAQDREWAWHMTRTLQIIDAKLAELKDDIES